MTLYIIWIILYTLLMFAILLQGKQLERSNQSREKLIAQLKEDAISRDQHTAMMKKLSEQYERWR